MVFIETSTFTKLVGKYLSDDEYAGLQYFMLRHPERGVVIPRTGGVRKLRWRHQRKGKGKRGGLRVIYYFKKSEDEMWMLTLYSKGETENIPSHILKKIAEEIKNA
jgi:hypothetical protein